MNKKTKSTVTAVMLSVLTMLQINSLTVYAEETDTFNLSEEFFSLYNNEIKPADVDYSLFDKFLKYSLLVSDKNTLSPEQLNLCEKIFTTERTYMTVTCNNARETLKKGTLPKRIDLNSSRIIKSLADLQSIPYELTIIFPEFKYYYFRGAGGDYSSYSEYWLDENGTERIICSSDLSQPVYEITVESKLDTYKEDELIEYCYERSIYLNPDEIECGDGRYKYSGVIKSTNSSDNSDIKVFTSGIWKYEVMDDNTAIIVDCDLPKYDAAELIKEPFVLPDKLDDHIVSGLYAGLKGTGITKLVVPDNYKYINELIGLDNLTELVIDSPDLVLHSSSIVSCKKLEKLTLNVDSIEENMLLGCYALKTIDIKGATGISCDAFHNIESLSEVTLPAKGLKYIGQDAFVGTSLKELYVPEDVEIAGMLKTPYMTSEGKLVDPLTEDNIKIVNDECVILSYYNTEGQSYAVANKCKFSPMDNLNYGDLTGDGAYNSIDVLTLQKWLLGNQNSKLSNWEYADFSKNGKLDIVDFCLIKSNLVK